jgi:hypothetical protein
MKYTIVSVDPAKGTGARWKRHATMAILGLALGGLAGEAAANLVERNETIGCSLHCQDSFEVKCTQKSRRLCVTVTGQSESLTTQFVTTGVATVPAGDLGEAYETVGGHDGSRTMCFTRNGTEGTMKALVSVAAIGPISFESYEFAAECSIGLFPFTESRQTTVARKQNE